MDRFDEMRSRIIKGSGGSGSSGNYNVFAQKSEPESKDGVWIKNADTQNGLKFVTYATQKGDFINPTQVSFLNNTSKIVGQVIINGIMYVFGTNSANSYKYDLKTQKVNNINAPTISLGGAIGAVEYNDKIYVFYVTHTATTSGADRFLNYYIYDFGSDTYIEPVNTGVVFSEFRTASAGGFSPPHVYNDKIYMVYGEYASAAYSYKGTFDPDTNTFTSTSIGNFTGASNSNGSYITSGSGQYIYAIPKETARTKAVLKRLDVTTNTITSIKTFLPTELGYNETYVPTTLGLYVNGDYVYMFGYYTSASNKYHRYNLTDGTLEEFETEYPYTIIQNTAGSGTGSNQMLVLNKISGLLYMKRPSYSCSAFQFEESPELMNLEDGVVVIIQSMDYSRPTIIQNSSNITVGIDDVLIVKEGKLNGDLIVYVGNGEEWKLLKGRVKVTFNSNGGSDIIDISAIYNQPISEPEMPTKEGYEFVYWTLNGQEYDFSTPVTEPITLVAQWIEISPTFVDYIEASGTQYINTGIKPTTDTTYEISVDITPQTEQTDTCLFGARPASGSQQFIIWDGYNTDDASHKTIPVLGSLSSDYAIYPDSTKNVFKYDGTNFYCNGESIFAMTNSTGACDYPIFLFALNNGGTADSRRYQGKVHYYKIWQGGTLVRDYKPCYDTHNVYCLYDSISNKYFYNQGTGSFVAE